MILDDLFTFSPFQYRGIGPILILVSTAKRFELTFWEFFMVSPVLTNFWVVTMKGSVLIAQVNWFDRCSFYVLSFYLGRRVFTMKGRLLKKFIIVALIILNIGNGFMPGCIRLFDGFQLSIIQFLHFRLKMRQVGSGVCRNVDPTTSIVRMPRSIQSICWNSCQLASLPTGLAFLVA